MPDALYTHRDATVPVSSPSGWPRKSRSTRLGAVIPPSAAYVKVDYVEELMSAAVSEHFPMAH